MNARIALLAGLATLVVLTPSVMSRPLLHTTRHRMAEGQEATDSRERIRLAPAERDVVLAEMRTMLESLSRIVHGLAAGDLLMAEKAARASGMKATVESRLEQKLPAHFLQLGRRVHTRFDQLAEAIKTGATKDDVLKRLAALTGYCVACHSAYRLQEVRPNRPRRAPAPGGLRAVARGVLGASGVFSSGRQA